MKVGTIAAAAHTRAGAASACPDTEETTVIDNVPAIALRRLALAIVERELAPTPAVTAKLIDLAARCGITAGPAAIVAAVRRAERA